MFKTLLRGGVAAAAIGALLPSAAAAVPADFQAKVDAYLQSTYPADGPGAAAVVVEDGKVVYSGGHGLADIGAKRKITPRTVFRLASLTKQFVASVILQLEQEGKLSLSDPLSKYLPDYPEPGADATIEQLLNHTSGIKSFTSMTDWMYSGARAKPITTAQLIDVFKNEPVDFPPGTEHQYSNSGYVLLGAVIEKITGKPWHVAVEERLARPLQLATIRYGVAESTMPEMAAGYAEKDGKVVPAGALHMSSPHAAGSLIGSAEDFARWSQALHHGKVLGTASYAKMIAPTKLPDGTLADYGYGMALSTLRGRKTLLHSGDTVGFDTSTIFLPGEDLSVTVFTNSEQPAVSPKVARMRIAALAMGEPFQEFQKREVAPAEIEPLLGVYRAGDVERRFFLKDGKLFTRRAGSSDEEVFAAGGDRFFYGPTTLTWFEVKRDAGGAPVMTMYHGAEQTPETVVRTGPIPVEVAVHVPRPVLERYVGTYKTVRGMVTVALEPDGTLTFQLGSQSPRQLFAKSETEFRLDGINAKVAFHAEDGPASHFTFELRGIVLRGDRQEV